MRTSTTIDIALPPVGGSPASPAASPAAGVGIELAALLHAHDAGRDHRWQRWARRLVGSPSLTADHLRDLWNAVVSFDPVLVHHLAEPVDVGRDAVLVAGSGKETLKTFNVSTAAAILAAAAGAKVVKGVSTSVSAISGSADVLGALSIAPVGSVEEIRGAVQADGIAFVPYAMFCPGYAAEYDGVFTDLNPFSFMMPIAVLAVTAGSFVYGIADERVDLSAEAIAVCRPDLARGSVLMTEARPGRIVDEAAPYGRTLHATIDPTGVGVSETLNPAAPDHWVRAVSHGLDHGANADRLVASLAPHNVGPGCVLVEENAALIWWEATGRASTLDFARRHVRAARTSGRAHRLLITLQERGL